MAVMKQAHKKSHHRAQMDFILLALRGKASGFEKVLKMIDEMSALLKEEQADDDNKKEYCEMQFDQTEDKKKGLDRQLSDEIAALTAGVAALDKSVAEATEQRKQENVEF